MGLLTPGQKASIKARAAALDTKADSILTKIRDSKWTWAIILGALLFTGALLITWFPR